MDSHPSQRTVVGIDGKDVVRNEGTFGHKSKKPYPIPYRSIIQSERTNLLVPVCLSSTHVAYGSIRMEPVFLTPDLSAGVAASMAMEIEAGQRLHEEWISINSRQ